MNTITDVIGVTVPVASQDDALAFFTEKLGFETRRDARMADSSRWVTVAAPGATIELALAPDRERIGHDTGIRSATTDAQAEHERLHDQGVTVDSLLRWPGVPPMFKFNDPDGNIYTIIQTP
ncbi:MAG: VOC family protein [Actinobacteria bacterium]|nr:VOC family protein [Actinomycetota bacterium]